MFYVSGDVGENYIKLQIQSVFISTVAIQLHTTYYSLAIRPY